mmetsp:Transcript_1831/g.5521  ORF Transcript_1831/g.5521 Transcript_1831/m.5521 type:complete len:477 (+) Transcript_1831:209-1639(+)
METGRFPRRSDGRERRAPDRVFTPPRARAARRAFTEHRRGRRRARGEGSDAASSDDRPRQRPQRRERRLHLPERGLRPLLRACDVRLHAESVLYLQARQDGVRRRGRGRDAPFRVDARRGPRAQRPGRSGLGARDGRRRVGVRVRAATGARLAGRRAHPGQRSHGRRPERARTRGTRRRDPDPRDEELHERRLRRDRRDLRRFAALGCWGVVTSTLLTYSLAFAFSLFGRLAADALLGVERGPADAVDDVGALVRRRRELVLVAHLPELARRRARVAAALDEAREEFHGHARVLGRVVRVLVHDNPEEPVRLVAQRKVVPVVVLAVPGLERLLDVHGLLEVNAFFEAEPRDVVVDGLAHEHHALAEVVRAQFRQRVVQRYALGDFFAREAGDLRHRAEEDLFVDFDRTEEDRPPAFVHSGDRARRAVVVAFARGRALDIDREVLHRVVQREFFQRLVHSTRRAIVTKCPMKMKMAH